MGMDVYGVKPSGTTAVEPDWQDKASVEAYFKWQRETKGAYFRNNCWWWRPLWNFVFEVCADIITDEEHDRGHCNDGYLIDADRALKISARLTHLIDQREVKKYEIRYMTYLCNLPLVQCWLCKGTGTRNDHIIQGKCNACGGTGKRKNDECSYPFSEENVIEFADFCRHCGGFTIC